jgi:MGT family glycosyltransferase
MSENKGTILISTMGFVLAHIGRTLLIAKELRKAGYEIIFDGQGPYLDLVREGGFEVLASNGMDVDHLLAEGRRRMVGADVFTSEGLDKLIQTDLKILNQVQPQAVICDLRPSMGIAATAAGVTCISLANAYITKFAEVPLSHLIFPPVIRYFLEPLRRRVASQPFRELSEKYSIPKNTIFRDLLTIGDLVLLPDLEEFSPTKNLPDHFRYCGPLIWEPTGIATGIVEKMDPEKQSIYFTLGSTGLKEMFSRVIQELQDTKYQVVLTTGNQINIQELGPLPGNFIIDKFVPGSQIMQRCVAVVCHGGNGTVYQALGTGRPVITLPTHLDQKANANLLVKQGAGIKIDNQNVKRLIPGLKKLLATPSYKANAERLKSLMVSVNGPKTAAELIESHI